MSQGGSGPSTLLISGIFTTEAMPSSKFSLFCCKLLDNYKTEIVSHQIFTEHLLAGRPGTGDTGFSKLPGLNLVQMVDLSFSLDGEKNKNAHTCTASREIPVQCQGFGYHYKENIATHVQNKL